MNKCECIPLLIYENNKSKEKFAQKVEKQILGPNLRVQAKSGVICIFSGCREIRGKHYTL